MKTQHAAMVALLLPLLVAGCSGDRRDSLPVVDGVLQTKVPGQERTGGGTSGAVMAAEGGRKPADPGPAGTPGIPLGSGGNTGGAEMGAVEMGAPTKGPVGSGPAASGAASAPTAAAAGAASGTAPGAVSNAGAGAAVPGAAPSAVPGAAPGAVPGTTSAASGVTPAAPASSAAPQPNPTQRAEVALAASIDAVARRWRARAAEQGWRTYPPTPVDPLAGIQAEASTSRTGSAPSGQPQGRLTAPGAAAPKTSEKQGTAAPSPDSKTATKPPTQPSVKARAPDAVN